MKIIVPLIGAVLFVAAVVLSVSVVLGVAGAYGLYRGGRAAWRAHQARTAATAHCRAELLARCEIQHRWYLAGDPRGTHGRYTPAS